MGKLIDLTGLSTFLNKLKKIFISNHEYKLTNPDSIAIYFGNNDNEDIVKSVIITIEASGTIRNFLALFANDGFCITILNSDIIDIDDYFHFYNLSDGHDRYLLIEKGDMVAELGDVIINILDDTCYAVDGNTIMEASKNRITQIYGVSN